MKIVSTKISRIKFGKMLKSLREDRGWRQIDLAHTIGISRPQTIAGWEKGVRYPSNEILFKISKLFNIEFKKLTGRAYHKPLLVKTNTIIEYKCIEKDNNENLTKEIMMFIKKGWELHGNTIVIIQNFKDGSSSKYYTQSIIKKEK
ncbi:MAG: helix-turn-helix transcriptional regulator [Thaumarchaeota archaeon]|nr:helix-turn-helix transcriptional regulator [Nitrososphaerota archaeon]